MAGAIAAVLGVLVLLEPDILSAPFGSSTTLAASAGATVLALVALVVMLHLDVAPVVRVAVLGIPFVVAAWLLLSPFFVDDVVDEQFATTIAAELGEAGGEDQAAAAAPAAPPDEVAGDTEAPAADLDEAPAGPVLLGAGSFVGLAGHSGTGEAGIFEDPDGSLALRFESFDIQNGPDLKVYLVPGADQTDLGSGSIHLGSLKGTVGDQTYELPAGTELAAGPYTALVWCDAFSVEFVGATLTIG